ncbi:MAG: phytanoyl-CoA dioxygenase family protein [Oceanicaulis sp.]
MTRFDGPWFDAPLARYDAERARLASEGVSDAVLKAAADLREDGLHVFDPGLPEDAIEAAAKVTAGLAGRWRRAQDLWRREPAVRRLAVHPELLAFLSAVFGRAAAPFQTLNFPVGTGQRPHADTFHFSTEPGGFMCGVWIALEDVGEDQGALVYYPGSQRLAEIDGRALAGRGGAAAYPDLVAERLEEAGLTPRRAPLKKGQAVIWAAGLVHGGGAITRDGASRLSQVTHYYFEDCVYTVPQYRDRPDRGVYVRQPFDLARGRFLPNRFHGAPVRPAMRALAGAWADRIARRVRFFG